MTIATIHRNGVTRIVILIGSWAIKLPRFDYGWRLGLQGLLANHQEEALWQDTRWAELCPVLWSVPGGFALIMRRARPLDDVEFEDFCLNGWIMYPDNERIPVEKKADSFGILDGRVVAVDYGS